MTPDEKKEEKEKEKIEVSEEKAVKHAEAAESWFADFFSFKMFITRPFIKIIYVIGAVLLTIGSIASMILGVSTYGGGMAIIYSLLMLILGNIGWRITCEVWIVFFRMHDILKSIDDSLKE